MNFPKTHYDIVDNCIMISGIFRSGTTILGKLIGSLKNAEYIFEPPISLHLDFLLQNKKIDSKIASELFRTYLSEDIMLNYHHGRNYNMRPSDDSCIFNMKDYKEVMLRWEQIKNVRNAVELYRKLDSRIIFKTPSAYSIIEPLMDNYKHMKVIEINRNLKSILSSVMAKLWLSDDSMTNEDYPAIWPYVENSEQFKIPYHSVSDDSWKELSMKSRSVKVLNSVMERKMNVISNLKKKYPERVMEIKYEDLLKSPYETVKKIAKFIKIELSQKTIELIEQISPTQRVYDVEKILENDDSEEKIKFIKYNKMLGYG